MPRGVGAVPCRGKRDDEAIGIGARHVEEGDAAHRHGPAGKRLL
jgi:hypothetical protein